MRRISNFASNPHWFFTNFFKDLLSWGCKQCHNAVLRTPMQPRLQPTTQGQVPREVGLRVLDSTLHYWFVTWLGVHNPCFRLRKTTCWQHLHFIAFEVSMYNGSRYPFVIAMLFTVWLSSEFWWFKSFHSTSLMKRKPQKSADFLLLSALCSLQHVTACTRFYKKT